MHNIMHIDVSKYTYKYAAISIKIYIRKCGYRNTTYDKEAICIRANKTWLYVDQNK